MKKNVTHPRGKARPETALNVGVPTALHTRIRVRAAMEGTTVKEIAQAALELFLDTVPIQADSSAA